MKYVFLLPDVGEGIHEAELVAYDISVNDMVTADQEIVKVETDKAVVALTAPVSGRVMELPCQPGDVLTVGDPIVVFETEVTAEEPLLPEPKEKVSSVVPQPQTTASPTAAVSSDNRKRVLATPHTRQLARDLGVDIKTVTGSGAHGRVTDADVQRGKTTPGGKPKSATPTPVKLESINADIKNDDYGPTRRVLFKGVRKRTAEVMVQSYSTIPHVTHSDEADVTLLLQILQDQKTWADSQGVKLTLTAFITRAVISALQAFPEVNSSLDEGNGEIVYKDYYHIGIATDTGHGLLVPVVKDADRKNVLQIAGNIQELAQKARNREIELEELRGGTFTITNIGALGGTHASPIIQPPQAAILAVLQARKKPVVVNDEVVIRSMLPLVVAFDHRLLDGVIMARFLNFVIELLQNPVRLLIGSK